MKANKQLCVKIDPDLYNDFAKICIDLSVSKTEAIVKYMQYLRNTSKYNRRLLDVYSKKDTFKLEANSAREVSDEY